MAINVKDLDFWSEDSGGTQENAKATHPAVPGIKPILDFISLQSGAAGKTWTVKSGSKVLFVGDIGDETLVLGVAFVGEKGQLISVELNTTGQVYISGHDLGR